MKRILILLALMFTVPFSGCSSRPRPPEPPKCRVVTQIQIWVENAAETGLCRYSDPHKLTKALNYLRSLDPWTAPDANPETVPGPRYRITLFFSDGSTKVYEQIAYAYLREAGSPWQEISSERALGLPLLLAAVASDTI